MRKKYLSALLFGALLFASAGTFTSCKDYDDDINNLQSQIDKLATKEDMEAKLSQMETAINDAKATAEEALKAAQEAGSADEIAKLEARIKALEDAALDVDALKKEIADSVEEQMADFREEMEKLLKEVEELTGYSLDMVTEVSFVAGNNIGDPNLKVNYARVKEIQVPEDLLPVNNDNADKTDNPTTYTFGKGYTGAFDIAEGDVNTVADYMLVNVAPVDAAVSADMLSLVNGKGQNLNEYLDLSIASWADDIIIDKSESDESSRAGETTGLRKVGVQLKNTVDFDAFDKLVIDGSDAQHKPSGECDGEHKYYAYALAVTDAEKSRTVTSPFEVTLHVVEEDPADDIDQATKINSSAASATDSKIIASWNKAGDDPDLEYCFPVALNDAFTIDVKSDLSKGGRVMASYVEVDYNHPDLSATDKAALKGLSFDGVNTVVKGETLKHSITIDGIAGIAVPLKLVTIDYTGKVQAFYVWVKAGAAVEVSAAYTITPKAHVRDAANFSIDDYNQMQAFTIPAGATKYSVEFTVGETAHKDDENHKPVEFKTSTSYPTIDFKELKATRNDVANQPFLKLYKADKKTSATKPSDVAYAEFTGALNLQMMREDKAYEGIVKFYDKTGTYLGANSIKVTKVLPTTVPSDFSEKTNGINNGVMTVYPTPIKEGDNKGKGQYLLAYAFNNWESNYLLGIDGVTTTNPKLGNYVAGTAYDPSQSANADFKGDDSDAMITDINSGIIQNLKSYPAVVAYNYGAIKYAPEGHGTEAPEDYKVTWGTNFNMQFNCWVVDCKYNWAKTPEVYYRETNIIDGIIKNDKGEVTAFENVIKATDPYGAKVDPFDAGDKDWTTWANTFNYNGSQNVEIILITTNNGKEVENEYFTAKFVTVDKNGKEANTGDLKNAMKLEPTGVQVKPSADVETKVILRIKDKLTNHTHDVPALTFTMKINHE